MVCLHSASKGRHFRNLSLTFWTLILVVASSILLPAGPGACAQSPLRIAYTDFAPFHHRPAGQPLQGFFHAIITEALEKRMGIPLEWSAYPWKRCQQRVRAGVEDALLTVPTAERLTYTVTHKTPFYQKRMHVFTRLGHPRMALLKSLKTLADIRNDNLITITYSGNSWHETHVASLGVATQETDPVDNVWRMLAARRGDIVIEWPHGAWPAIRRLKLEEAIVDTGVQLAAMSFHLLIHKDSPQVAVFSRFDTSIEEMRVDGTIAAILAPFEGD